MTDFLRLITAMPRDPHWQAPNTGQREQTAQRQGETTHRIEANRPHLLALPPGTPDQIASDQREQFSDGNRSFFETWISSYQQAEGPTEEGLGNHQQVLNITYLMTYDALQGGDPEGTARRLRQFREEMSRYTNDVQASSLSAEDKLAEVYGVILQPAMALSMLIANSPAGNDSRVQTELRALTQGIRQSFDRLVTLNPGGGLEFFRQFSMAQVDLMGLLSQDPPPPAGETLTRSRSIVQHLDRAVELSRVLHPAADTPLADFVAIVQAYAPAQRAGLQIPSDRDLARGIITGNTLLAVTTIASEIDLSHRVPETQVNERYFRLNQTLEALLTQNPRMNFQEAVQALGSLQWDEGIYDRVAESGIPVSDAVAVFSGERRDAALRERLLGLIRQAGEPAPSDAQIVASLRGTPLVRQITPPLLDNLLHDLDQAPATDPNRQWILEYFRARDPEVDIGLLQRQLMIAVQTQQEPSQQVTQAVLESGEAGRQLVESLVEELRQEAQARDREAQIPAWLTRLAEGHFERPRRDVAAEVRLDLQNLRQRLQSGERIREGQDRTYDDLLNIFVNARDRDTAHLQDLLTVSGPMDDDHEILTELIDLDRQAVEGGTDGSELRTSAYVNRWAEGILNHIARHSYNYAEAFIHDDENHPGSYRVIAHLLAGTDPTSVDGQLHALTGSHLNPTLRERAHRIEGEAQSTVHGIGTALASWENLAFTGLMFGSSQGMTRAITSTETVASGTRISLGNFLPRFIARSPFTSSALTSLSIGMGYALSNEQYHQVHHENSTFGQDFLWGTAVTMAVLSPFWGPSWIGRVQRLPQLIVNHPVASSALAGGAYAGFMGLSRSNEAANRHQSYNALPHLAEDFGIGFGTGMAFLAPSWAPRLPIAGPLVLRGGRGVENLFESMSIVAENGQLGLAGHGLVATGTGLGVGFLGAGLQAGRDSAGGYETHFWQDVRSSTVVMGTGLMASSVLGVAVQRPLMNIISRRLRVALASESAASVALTRGRLAEGSLAVGGTLLNATLATTGMLAGTAMARAWADGHPLPHGSDLHFSGEELGVTFLNMLAFETMNNVANRVMLRNTLGRVRATQLDHIVDRLMAGVEIPNGENPETMRNFLWNRLALETLRGTDLSHLHDPEVIQNWRASFRELQSRGSSSGDPSSGTTRTGRLRDFARRLIGGRLDVDSDLMRERPGVRSREGSYALDLQRREAPPELSSEAVTDIQGITDQAIPAMIQRGRSTLPPQEVYVDHTGAIHTEPPVGDHPSLAVSVQFSGDRIYLAPRTRRALREFFSSGETTGTEGLHRVLRLHGQRIPIPPLAQAYTRFLAQVRHAEPRGDVSFVITRANPNPQEPPPRMIYRDDLFEVYAGPVEAVPEERRGEHLLAEIVIPERRRGRGPQAEPEFRVRIGEGQWDNLPLTLRTLFSNLPRSEGIRPRLIIRSGDQTLVATLPRFFVGNIQTIEASQFNGQVPVPEDFRMSITRTAEGHWQVTNLSRDGTTIRVGERSLRNREFSSLNDGADLIVQRSGQDPITLQFQLSETVPPSPPPAAPSSSDPGGAGGPSNPPIETAPSASQPANPEGANMVVPASTTIPPESEAPLSGEPTQMGPSPSAPATPTAPSTAPTLSSRILKMVYQDPQGRFHPVSVTLTLEPLSENWMGTLGREHFPFLDGEERTISREHLRIRVTPENEISAQEIDSRSGLPRADVAIQTGETPPRATFVLRVDGVIAEDGSPVFVHRTSSSPTLGTTSLRPEGIASPLQPLTQIVLSPRQQRPLSTILGLNPAPRWLENFQVIRGEGPDSPLFWLFSDGDTDVTLTREYGDHPNIPLTLTGRDPVILGELGENIWLRIGEGNEPTYPLFLDDPQGTGNRLPRVTLNYHEREGTIRFRSSDPRLIFGRAYNPEIFLPNQQWISREHFTLTMVQDQGRTGYALTVRSQFGLYLGGTYFARGQRIFLPPGRYEIRSILRSASPSEGGPAMPELDLPLTLTLPQTDLWLPGWNPQPAGPSAPPRPPSPRPPSRPAVSPPSGGVLDWLREIFRRR